MVTDDWPARFVEIAKRMRMATPEPGRPSSLEIGLPENRKQALAELSALLPDLYLHLTQAEIDRLMRDEDPDVRLAAAMTLGSKNRELKNAAMRSAMFGVGVDESLASLRRAHAPSPSAPRLEEATAEQLVARLIDACERLALAHQYLDWGFNRADLRTCNRRVREVIDVQESLKRRDFASLARPLMDHPNLQVRLSAALVCLACDEPRAVATLEEIERTGSSQQQGTAFSALSRHRSLK